MPPIVSLPNAPFLGEVRRLIRQGHTVTLTVRGFSMQPFLEDRRDKVVLTPCDDIRTNDVILAEVAPGRYVLPRVVGLDGDRITLMGDGNSVGKETCSRTDVVARATAFYRKGKDKAVSVDSRRWKAYTAIWTHLLPFRRYLLAFHRRIWLKITSHSLTHISDEAQKRI